VTTDEREKSEQEKKQSKKVLQELKSVLLVKQKEFEVNYIFEGPLVSYLSDTSLARRRR
jgi:hypothetical protein